MTLEKYFDVLSLAVTPDHSWSLLVIGHNFTTTTRILHGFCFLLLIRGFVIQTSLGYERKNEKDSGRRIKMTPSCKWPIRGHSCVLLDAIGHWSKLVHSQGPQRFSFVCSAG